MGKAAELGRQIISDFANLGIPEKDQNMLMAALRLGSTMGDEHDRENWQEVIAWLRTGNALAVKYAEELADIVAGMPPAPATNSRGDREQRAWVMPEDPLTSRPTITPALVAKEDTALTPTPVAAMPESTATAETRKQAVPPVTDCKARPAATAPVASAKAAGPVVRELAPANTMPGPIRLADIGVSTANRSYEYEHDVAYAASLAAHIEQDGQLQGIILVNNPGGPKPYAAVAGANRLAAQIKLQGPDGVLRPGEYVLRDDLVEGDVRCVALSVSENLDRRGSSPHQVGVYAARLVRDYRLTQEQVGVLLRLPRETIGALIDLAENFDRLPECWRDDLRLPPECDSNHTPAIMRTHWSVVATAVANHGMPPALRKLLERARTEHWSVSRLSQAVADFRPNQKRASPPATGVSDAAGKVATAPQKIDGAKMPGTLNAVDHIPNANACDRAAWSDAIAYLESARAAFLRVNPIFAAEVDALLVRVRQSAGLSAAISDAA